MLKEDAEPGSKTDSRPSSSIGSFMAASRLVRFFLTDCGDQGQPNPARPWAEFLSWPLRPATAAMVSSNLLEWWRLF